MDIDVAQVCLQIENFLKEEIDEFQRQGAVLGMSGGIDSAVVGSLLTRALGPENVLALLLPERDSSADSRADALLEIQRLGISWREIDLAPALSALGIYKLAPLKLLGTRAIQSAVVRQQYQQQLNKLGETPFKAGLLGTAQIHNSKTILDAGQAYTRIKHRMRMVALYYVAEQENRLVVGTTNKSEAMTGFVVKWGDNVADVEPIVGLYKTQVRQLATYLGVSQKVIDKAPTPDLIPGIVDELALGIDYATLDKVLWGLDQGWQHSDVGKYANATLEQVNHVIDMTRRSEHLRKLPSRPELFV
jgi:NAD+ synthase